MSSTSDTYWAISICLMFSTNRCAFAFAFIEFARVGSGDWNGKPGDLLGGGLWHHDWRRQRTVSRHVERGAIGQDAGSAAQSELALLGEIAIDFQI